MALCKPAKTMYGIVLLKPAKKHMKCHNESQVTKRMECHVESQHDQQFLAFQNEMLYILGFLYIFNL